MMDGAEGALLDDRQTGCGDGTGPCTGCDVRGIALCGSLGEDGLDDLGRVSRRRVVRQGETLFWTDEDSVLCAQLISGTMKLSAISQEGAEQIVGLLVPGDLVGQPFRARVDYNATALTDTELCVAPRGDFERLLDAYPAMERALLVRTLSDLSGARRSMVSLARSPALERVAGFLLALAPRDMGGAPVTLDLPLSRGQIADFLGLTIETVSRQFTRLKAEGIIAVSGLRSVTILLPDRLKAAVEGARVQ